METEGKDVDSIFSSLSVPPSGGSLEIGNPLIYRECLHQALLIVPPSGGSLEIGNDQFDWEAVPAGVGYVFPLRGDP